MYNSCHLSFASYSTVQLTEDTFHVLGTTILEGRIAGCLVLSHYLNQQPEKVTN